MMRYHNITKDDMLNGVGLRVVLWVAGCNHYCNECHNPVTWDPLGGIPFDDNAKQELFTELEKDYVHGITLSGGDPLYPDHREAIYQLAKEIKEKYPQKSIWLYTGFLWEEIKDLPVIPYIDVVVDGPFQKDLKKGSYHWAGSTNQRVIDAAASLEKGRVILYDKQKK